MTPTTYMTTEELAARLHYDARYIREQLMDSVLVEGIHYVRPFGRRKILFKWCWLNLVALCNFLFIYSF